jgi:aspartate aminotransferase-like enzyme
LTTSRTVKQAMLRDLGSRDGEFVRMVREIRFSTVLYAPEQKGFVIYPGKVGNANCFRIGCIGRLFPCDFQNLMNAMRATLLEMHVLPAK